MNRPRKSCINISLLLAGTCFGTAAYAQSGQQDAPAELPAAADVAAEEEEKAIVVTGSRLRRNEYTSPSPLSVLDIEEARNIGVNSVQELLSRSVQANGAQIDLSRDDSPGGVNGTIGTLPPGGAGSSNVALRGLGPERTLVLVNGRRLASTGVRGAPSQPDINLIPFSMIERVEIATDAGSSVYGADAVAGTVNVILRNDFEGLELSGTYDAPEASGGELYQFGFLAGAQADRARILFGAEYFDRQRVLVSQRRFTRNGLRAIRVNEAGELLDPQGIGGILDGASDNFGFLFGAPTNAALNPTFPGTNRPVLNPFFNFVAYTPGESDIGIANFSTFCGIDRPGGLEAPAGLPSFCTANGVRPNANLPTLSLRELNDFDERQNSDLVGGFERLSLVVNGEVDLNLFGHESQFYFEAMYLNRQSRTVFAAPNSIFPLVPADIPVVDAVTGERTGAFVDNPLNPFDGVGYLPILSLEDFQQDFDVELQQSRVVTGLRGDFTDGWLGRKNWSYDAYFSYDRGVGFVSQPTIFTPHFVQAIYGVAQTTDGRVVCGIPGFNLGAAPVDSSVAIPNCVPINWGSASLYTGGTFGGGTFGTQAERDYLTVLQTNRTVIEQYVGFGFLQGELFDSPWGDAITVGFGAEFRRDIIDSQADVASVQGASFAQQEGLTRGSRDFREVFGEIDIPLVVGRPGIELLNLDGAVRYTDETNFGDDLTFRTRLQYKPVTWFSLSGGYGTSFRAPNLRESFLADQIGGAAGSLDPCNSGQITFALLAGGDSDPAFVNRINNCVADGVVFTDSNNNGFLDTTALGTRGDVGIGVIRGGAADLLPETSRTFTVTAQFEQPWTSAFNFSVAASYFDIQIENTVRETAPEFVIQQCYLNPEFPELSNPLCDRVTRTIGTPGGVNDGIATVDASFINVGEITARGIDIATSFGTELGFWKIDGEAVYLNWSTATAILLEQEEQVAPTAPRDDNVGEIGSPGTRFFNTFSLGWRGINFLMQNRFIGSQQQDDTPVTAFSVFGRDPSGQLTRPVSWVGSQWIHDIAISFTRGKYTISAGINNVTDEEPPLVDFGVGAPNNNNAVTGTGYDLFGRSFFVSARVSL
ncbi:hypothetical protein C0V72_12905 [Porphyrobacter sp. TH134]|uniref:TonB-dependent receptor domain-containing protein n=1 Tax=Porphyrobacter sp. TH134 TaxID=2067450 RepID=UPI000C79AC20|nr:TonB-dependent receptor [Porphyrobacter sp. TH134]PLK22797.1 hypothetical protein C0V72_12905 [Porphyrobacter sp. TH134]